jgi:tetratricopeptide (TPR) repeat protein
VTTVSLCVIARDEEADLGRCLESVKDDVDEIVLVDTGSRDRTIEVARAHGARVVERAWDDDFSAARNASIEAATSEWILVLDCDEELAPSSRGSLRSAIGTEKMGSIPAGFRLRLHNLTPPGEAVAYHEVRLTRLFRRTASHRYEQRIHEQIAPSIERAGGRIGEVDVVVLHHGYARQLAQGTLRAERNLRLLERSVRDAPDDPYLAFELGCTLRALGRLEEARAELERARGLDRDRLAPSARATLLTRLSQLALARKDDRQARTLAEESLRIDPTDGLARQVLALASVGCGDLVAALGAFEALRSAPNLTSAYRADVEQVISALRGALAPSR